MITTYPWVKVRVEAENGRICICVEDKDGRYLFDFGLQPDVTRAFIKILERKLEELEKGQEDGRLG